MRFRPALVLGTLLGTSYVSALGPRQDTSGGAGDAAAPPTAPVTTVPPPPPTSDSPPPGGSSTSSGGGDTDTTVTETKTVTGSGSDVHSTTTTTDTTTTTIVITDTSFGTTSTTRSDITVATVYVASTITKTADKRRAVGFDVSPPTAIPHPTQAVAQPPMPTAANFDGAAVNGHELHKRSTVTITTTTTVGGGDGSTVVDTSTVHVTKTKTTQTVTTSYITNVVVANAKSTVTSTTEITVTSTSVSTGDSTSPPTGNPSDNGGSSSSSSSGGGLSTGAKAGIGVGAGVGGLAVIGIILFCCFRHRRRSPKAEPDDFAGASEFPVRAPSSSHAPTMSSHTPTAAAFLAPGRTPVKPNREGYRGTAMGDGRAGYAKPESYSSPYSPSNTLTTSGSQAARVSPLSAIRHPDREEDVTPPRPETAELGTDNTYANRWYNADATEIDGAAASRPVPNNVYEMPDQPYR